VTVRFLTDYFQALRSPTPILAWIVLSIAFSLAGPYGTYEQLSVVARSGFWAGAIALAVLAGVAFRVLIQLIRPELSYIQATIGAAFLDGAVVAVALPPAMRRLVGLEATATPGPLELLGLTGNLVPDEHGVPVCHLHIIASKSSGDVVGGHMQDAEVFASCEIVLAEQLVEGVSRHRSESAGTANIFFDEEAAP
jgi:predicted DNA-binding protein with PD1-like motif